jgi:hypothetical protein
MNEGTKVCTWSAQFAAGRIFAISNTFVGMLEVATEKLRECRSRCWIGREELHDFARMLETAGRSSDDKDEIAYRKKEKLAFRSCCHVNDESFPYR